jgi:flagellar motor switch protein FliN/FliY
MSLDLRPVDWFAGEWAGRLADVLESLSGERPQVESKQPAAPATLAGAALELAGQFGEILWWCQNLALPGSPAVWIGAPQKAWLAMADRASQATGTQAGEGRQTYAEIVQKALGELVRAASSRWSQEAGGSQPGEQPAAPAAAPFYLVNIAYPNAALPPLLIAITGEPSEPVSAPVPAPAPSSQRSKTFDLLMDVELPVSVSFGHVQIPLRDIMKLTAGSIVELNRAVDEPVEVIVNNCVVARGEVVVVGGNYGVRINQIMSRQQRLESLP